MRSMASVTATTLSAIAALAAFTGRADAHHSFASFDLTKHVTLEGTVKEFQSNETLF